MSSISLWSRVLTVATLCLPLCQHHAFAQGNLANGANVTGSISNSAEKVTWTFNANKYDDITVSISESGPNTSFYPEFHLLGPGGTDYGYAWGDLSALRHITAGATGLYKVIVSRYDNNAGIGRYLLTMARSPGAFEVPEGDEGGPINNGQNYSGTILRGDLDQWSFDANKGDDITVSASEVGPNTSFYPEIQIIGPDSTNYGYSWGDLSAIRHFTAGATGSYKVVVSRYDNSDGAGSYQLTLARAPATFVVPGNDEGGPMMDGGNYSGSILRGDLDMYSFTANKYDDITVSVSQAGSNTDFYPELHVIGPDGSDYGYGWGDLTAERHFTALSSGAYTVVVSRYDNGDDVGDYLITLAKAPGTFVVPEGDQGGSINNGQNYRGTISRGDLDQWSFNANKGDDITVSASETGPNTSFYPEIHVIGPDGADYGYGWGDLWAERHFTALSTGPYTVVVSRYDNADGVGNYRLTLARSPAGFVVTKGDDGGFMAHGAQYPGTILRGDLDQWTFNATKGKSITVTASEPGTNTSFYPEIHVIGPDGSDYGYSWGDILAQRTFTALTSGTYKVVVSRYDNADGIGHYLLSVH